MGGEGSPVHPGDALALLELSADYVFGPRRPNQNPANGNLDMEMSMVALSLDGDSVGLAENAPAPASVLAIAGQRPRDATGLIGPIVLDNENKTYCPTICLEMRNNRIFAVTRGFTRKAI